MGFSIATKLYPTIQFQDIFITPRTELHSISCHSHSTPQHWEPLVHFLSLWICPFWTFHINVTILYMVFCDWLLSLSMIFSRFIHVIVCSNTSFLFMAEQYSILQIYHILFIHLVVMDTWVVPLWDYKICNEHCCACFCIDTYFHFSWIPQGGIGNSMFNLLKRCQNVFLSRKQSNHQHMRAPIFLCPCQHFLSPVFFFYCNHTSGW